MARDLLSAVAACLATVCTLIGCATPTALPSPAEPHTPYWSASGERGEASIEVLGCHHVDAYLGKPSCWVMNIRARVIANNRATADAVASSFCDHFADVGPHVAYFREVGGPEILLVERGRMADPPAQSSVDLDVLIDPLMPGSAQQLPSGEWMVEGPAQLVATRQPVGRVELTIDGDALRIPLCDQPDILTAIYGIPPGCLTARLSVLTVPAPTPDTPDAPPTSGAEIAPPSNITPPSNR